MTHRGVIKQPWSSAVRTPEKGPRRLPGLLEPSELFHGGPPVRFRRRGWYRDTPPRAAPSEHHAGRWGAHQQAVPVASTAMLLAGYWGARRGLSTSARAAGLLGTAFGRVWITPRGGDGSLRKGGPA